jgi:hypothetical protein
MLSYHSLMTLNRIANSLVTRIVLLGIAFMLLGTVLRLFVLSQYLREDISTVMASQQLALANYVARDVDHKMLERQRLLTQMAATLPLDLLGHPEKLREWLGIRYALQPLFSEGVFVTGKDGMALADYPQRVERDGLDYNDRDYVRAAIAGEISMGTPVMGRVARKPIVPMAAPVRDASGQVRAVLAGCTGLSFVQPARPHRRTGRLSVDLAARPFVYCIHQPWHGAQADPRCGRQPAA